MLKILNASNNSLCLYLHWMKSQSQRTPEICEIWAKVHVSAPQVTVSSQNLLLMASNINTFTLSAILNCVIFCKGKYSVHGTVISFQFSLFRSKISVRVHLCLFKMHIITFGSHTYAYYLVQTECVNIWYVGLLQMLAILVWNRTVIWRHALNCLVYAVEFSLETFL
jgi:hypothetical protein